MEEVRRVSAIRPVWASSFGIIGCRSGPSIAGARSQWFRGRGVLYGAQARTVSALYSHSPNKHYSAAALVAVLALVLSARAGQAIDA
jgi:hypothetical protein